MATQSPKDTSSPSLEGHGPLHVRNSHTSARRGQRDTSEPSNEPTTTSPASISNPLAKLPRGSPLQVYLRSDQPVDKRTKPRSYHNHSVTAQANPHHEEYVDDGTDALDNWMAAVTADPHLASRYRDMLRVLPSTEELYRSMPSASGQATNNHQHSSIPSQGSMTPAHGSSMGRQS